MRLKLIACEVLYREFCTVVAQSPNVVDVEFLPKGLHDIGQKLMSRRLREVLAAVDPDDYDAVLWGYGLCSNGLVGLQATKIPLIVPRAHDCMTLFLGSKERYLDYFTANPGVYFKTSGWIERAQDIGQYGPDSIQQQHGMVQSYEEMVEKYGADNAKFIYEQLHDMTANYSQMTFVEMGIELDDRFERETERQAADKEMKYAKVAGDMTLIRQLVDGPWDDDRFLTVRPGHRVATSFNESIICEEAA